jgi:AcrR family transcriptional regulator
VPGSTESEGSRRARVLAAATEQYLHGERVDMSDLAARLGISRATLYRWAGSHDEVLAAVLAEETERTFRHAAAHCRGTGADRVLGVIGQFMDDVLASAPLKSLTARDPHLFVRLATAPGVIEARAIRMIETMVEEEVAAGRLVVDLEPEILAEAIVRVADAFMYRHLLGADSPATGTALRVIALLLRVPPPSD